MSNEEKVSVVIGKTIGMYPKEVINLLTKNGVVVDADSLDLDQLILATFSGVNTNKTFKNELGKFIDEKQIITASEKEYLNFGASDYVSAGTTLLNSATNFLGSKDALKSAQTSANAQLESNKTALELAKIQQQTELFKIQSQQQVQPSSNTALYVGLGVGGLIVVGFVVYLATKK